jgi:hypothetical protein
MRRRHGRRGRRWPTAARAGLSVPREPWTLLQAALSIKEATGAPARLPPLPAVRHCTAAMEPPRPSFAAAS